MTTLTIGTPVRVPSGRAGVVIRRPRDVSTRPGEVRDCQVWVRVTLAPARWSTGEVDAQLTIEACYDGRDLVAL